MTQTAYPKVNIVDANGDLVSFGGASGGGGDASATNQETEITRLEQIRDRLGNTTDTAASDDTGNYSFISFFKRLLQKLQTLITNLPSTTNPVLVRNVSNKFREDFAGTSLNSNWQVIQTGTGQTISVANSELTIAAGTTANSETIIRSLVGFTIPMRPMWTFYLSQRIANQEIYFELTDSGGNNCLRFQFTGVPVNNINTQTVNNTNNVSYTSTSVLSTTSYNILEADIGIDQIDIFSKYPENTNGRIYGATKTRFIPDPGQVYYLQIRVKNLVTAPASNTNVVLDSITCQDIEEFTTEISSGRGSGNVGQCVPVTVLNSPSVSISNAVTSNSYENTSTVIETTAALGIAAAYNGSTKSTGLQRNFIRGWVFTDASGTLVIEQSTDASTWRQTLSLSISGGSTPTLFDHKIYASYYRIKYTNGAAAQTVLQIIGTQFFNG